MELLGDGCSAGAVGIDAPDGDTDVGSVEDYAARTPSATACAIGVGQHLRRATSNGNLLQFVIGEKSEISGVGRPEGEAGTFGSPQERCRGRADALNVNHRTAGGVFGGK